MQGGLKDKIKEIEEKNKQLEKENKKLKYDSEKIKAACEAELDKYELDKTTRELVEAEK